MTMTKQEFEKLLDEYGAFCLQEGFTGSENAGDCANDVRKQIIEAYDRALLAAEKAK